MELANFLEQVPLFQGLPRKQLLELAELAEKRAFDRGESIFAEGDEGTGFYVVLSGQVRVFKLSPEGREQVLHIFGPGEPFGEVPVFAGEHFPAHAEALQKSRLLFFSRRSFIDLIEKEPGLAMNMLAVLSRRLRQFTRLIEDLSLKEVPGRLAAYLLYASEGSGKGDLLELDISKAQLASILGTIPETLSRILAKMSQSEMIEVKGRTIRIRDREALEELSIEGKLA
jgi:CRP/FNR family transcriptional regulator